MAHALLAPIDILHRRTQIDMTVPTLSRSPPLFLGTSGSGHEARLPPTRLSAGNGFRKETIAGMRHNEQDAPTPAIHAKRKRGTEAKATPVRRGALSRPSDRRCRTPQ